MKGFILRNDQIWYANVGYYCYEFGWARKNLINLKFVKTQVELVVITFSNLGIYIKRNKSMMNKYSSEIDTQIVIGVLRTTSDQLTLPKKQILLFKIVLMNN